MAIEQNHTNNELNSIIQWCEKKRLFYNGITLCGGLIVFLERRELINGLPPLLHLGFMLFILFGANISYTVSWALEFLLNYYLKIPFWNNNIRKTLFVLGSIYSFIWMIFLTH